MAVGHHTSTVTNPRVGPVYASPPAMLVRPHPRATSRLQPERHRQHCQQWPARTTHLRTVAPQSKAHGKAAQWGKNPDETSRPHYIFSPHAGRRGRGVCSAVAKLQTRMRVRFYFSRFAVIATVQTRLTNSSALDRPCRAAPPAARSHVCAASLCDCVGNNGC